MPATVVRSAAWLSLPSPRAPDEEERHRGGEGDVDEVVAQQDGGEKALRVGDHPGDPAGAGHAGVHQMGDGRLL